MESHPREVSLPAEAFDHLRAALVKEAGDAAGVHALHAAGFSTGESMYELFSLTTPSPPGELGQARFFTSLTRFFRSRGWGSLTHESRHPGVSVLGSADWAEAESAGEAHPTCAFSSGVLSSLLTRAAGAPVAVLETTCRARGDARCEFAFGSEATIQAIYGALVEGDSLDEALALLQSGTR